MDRYLKNTSAVLLSWILIVLTLGQKFFEPIVPLDEGITLTYPELILKGYVPNLDFCSLYPPGNYWLLALAFKIFGVSQITERSVGLGYILAVSAAVYFLAVRQGIVLAMLLASITGLVLQRFPDALAAYSWFGAVAFILWSLVAAGAWLQRGEGVRRDGLLVAAGLLCGIALVFRHDLAIAAVVSGITAIGFRRRAILVFGLGLALGGMPLLLHAFVVSPALLAENLIFDVLRAGPTRRLPLNYASPTLWLVMLSCIVPAVLAAMQFRRFQRPGYDRLILALVLLNLCIIPQMLSRADAWHLTYVGAFTIPIALLVCVDTVVWFLRDQPNALTKVLQGFWPVSSHRSANTRRALNVMLVGAFLSGVVVWRGVTLYLEVSHRLAPDYVCKGCVSNEGRTLAITHGPEALQIIVGDLEARSTAGARLFVGPRDLSRTNYNDSFIYFLFPKLAPGNYYIEMASAVANRPGSKMARDLERADFVVLNSSYDNWPEDNLSKIAGSTESLAILAARFCLVSEKRPYELYERCSLRNTEPHQ